MFIWVKSNSHFENKMADEDRANFGGVAIISALTPSL